jgi:hypothetical protein
MARVTAYQATDKQLFIDRKDYILHQTNINAAEDVRKLVQASPDASPATEVEQFIVGNLNVLREIFSRKFNPSEKSEALKDEEPVVADI